MEELLSSSEIKVGDKVKGVVVKVDDKAIYLDIKQFTEGKIYCNEYALNLESFKDVVKLGDEVEAIVKKVDDENGSILLSRIPLIKKENEEKIKQLCADKSVITVKITKNVGRGLVANYNGNEVFIPVSMVDLKEVDLASFVGKEVKVELLEYNEKRRHYVASRKAILYREEKEAKEKELKTFTEGMIVKGEVVKIEEHLGAFVKFNHNQGLIKTRQLSHIPFKSIEEVVKIGDIVECKVIKVDGNKIDLSRKALLKTPYEEFVEAHKVSDVIEGKVVQKLPFGLIVEVAPYVTGLLHANEITWNPNDNKMASIKVNEVVKVAIISLDKSHERIGLSMKVLEDNPWLKVKAKVGETIKATITSIVPGRYLTVSALGVDGIIPVTEVPMKEKSSKLEDYYSVGDEVDAVITFLDTRLWKLELSIKRFTSRVEREQFESYMQKEKEKETTITLGDLFSDVLKK